MMKKLLKHPWAVILPVLTVTVFFGLQIGSIRIENTMRSFFPQKHESYRKMLEAEGTFGSMNALGIALETDGPSVITAESVAVIDRITERLENTAGVESVDSLSSMDYVYGEDGALSASSLTGGDFSGTPEELEELRYKISDWEDMYDRVILSDDGRAAQILVALQADADAAQTEALLREIRQIAAEETEGSSLTVRFYGDPVLSEYSKTFMLSDLARLIPLVSVIVLVTLFLSFKTLDGTLLPLITVLVSTVWTCGLMALFDVTFTLVSSVIPVALIGVGSAYGIHVLSHYYAELDRFQGEMTKEAHLEIIAAGLRDVRTAVFLAGLTTVAGFISLISSPLGPLHSFAVFSAIGVGLSLLLAVLLIPAMLALKPVSRVGIRSARAKRFAEKMRKKMASRGMAPGGNPGSGLLRIYRLLCGSKVRLALFLLFIGVCSYFGLARLKVDSALINYFSPDSGFRQDVAYADENFAGTNSLYFIIQGEEKGAMTNPEILKAVDDLQAYLLSRYPDIGKTVSFTTFIKRMNQVMHIPEASGLAEAGYAGGGFSGGGEDMFPLSGSFYTEADAGEEADTDTLSSFGSFSFEEFEESESSPAKEFTDPNIEYARRLNTTMTVGGALEMLNRVYFQAGGKHATVEDMIVLLEKELNFNGMDYYEIPYDTAKYPASTREELSDLVSQYLLLFSGSLDRFADDPLAPQSIRMMIQLRTHSTDAIHGIVQDARSYAGRYFPEGYSIYATGNAEMQYVMTNLIVSSQISSLLVSVVIVFVILAVAFRSAWAGLLGAVPLALTILLNYMVMGFSGINLDLITSIIASVAIGVGIDYTIHFLTTYKNERALSGDLPAVLCGTFAKSGRGIVTNAVAVGLGFLVLVFSEFIVLRYIGVLVATVMFTSSILAMTVIPGFLVIFDPKFIRPETGNLSGNSERRDEENTQS